MYISPIPYDRKNILKPLVAVGSPKENALYLAETAQRFHYKTRHITWDGCVFKYSKSGGACYAGQGADFYADPVQTYAKVYNSEVVGADSVVITGGTHLALTQDQLVGGMVIVYGDSNADVQRRGIIGNDAADANVNFKIYLDAPLVKAIIGTSAGTGTYNGIEAFYNEYADLRLATSVAKSKAGVPACEVTAANLNFWCQTWGLCWIAPQTGVGEGKEREAVWRHDGSLQENSGVGADDTTQCAGFVVTGSKSGAGPLFMLQISPV